MVSCRCCSLFFIFILGIVARYYGTTAFSTLFLLSKVVAITVFYLSTTKADAYDVWILQM